MRGLSLVYDFQYGTLRLRSGNQVQPPQTSICPEFACFVRVCGRLSCFHGIGILTWPSANGFPARDWFQPRYELILTFRISEQFLFFCHRLSHSAPQAPPLRKTSIRIGLVTFFTAWFHPFEACLASDRCLEQSPGYSVPTHRRSGGGMQPGVGVWGGCKL